MKNIKLFTMAYKTVEVDIEFDEFDNDDLIEELCRRIKRNRLDKDELKGTKSSLIGIMSYRPKKQSLNDILIEELFKEAAQKYSLVELQKRLA
jgi:uncharacterized membrane-anchored protein YjiN (DUF445 family)